jgi:polyhydroxyalkanoate synthesis repressor PhaR
MSETRIIKKYPNRRLYDCHESRYITLQDIKVLVQNYQAFKVVHAKTNHDLTRVTLLQIIQEHEEKGDSVLTAKIMEHMIRFSGDPLQEMMSKFLEHSMVYFLEQQAFLRSPVQQTQQGTSKLDTMLKENIQRFKE